MDGYREIGHYSQTIGATWFTFPPLPATACPVKSGIFVAPAFLKPSRPGAGFMDCAGRAQRRRRFRMT
jgi:hypothetical protein